MYFIGRTVPTGTERYSVQRILASAETISTLVTLYLCACEKLFFFGRFMFKLREVADNAFDVDLLCLSACSFLGRSWSAIHLKFFCFVLFCFSFQICPEASLYIL